MIVMKNNDFKSSKRILPSKKMLCTASLLISKEIEKYIQKKENQLVDKLQQAGFLSTKLTVRQADKLEEELTNILQSHNEEFISLLKKYQEQGKTLEDVLNALPNFNQSRATAVKSAINTAVYNNLTEMIPKVANKYLKNIDGELEIKQMTKTTVNWIKTWSKNLADIMNINTEEMLRNTLVNGINGGIGIDEISRNMVDNGALKTRVRARTTAVTEVLTANRIAAQEAIIQSPETNRKQWKHSGSYKIRPRENHIKMNGQVVLKTQPFKMIGADGKTYYPMIPGDTSLPPAERINCHCIVSPVLDDSVFNMTLEERQALQQKCIQEYDEFNGLNTDNSLDNSQESGIMEERILIPRSVGASGRNYPVRLPDGNHTKFVEGTEITNIKVFAGKGTNVEIRNAIFLESTYKIPASEWKKVRGNGYVIVDGEKMYAEIHWYEADADDRYMMKVKRYLDES